MDILFALQSYKDESLAVSAQDIVNCYAELEPPDAKTPVKVSGVPGVDLFATCGAGPIRGAVELKGIAYVVSGQELYSLTATGATAICGVGIGGSGLVGIDTNEFQVAITDGANGWIYNVLTGVFSQITDPNFLPAATVTSIDEYFIFDHASTDQFFLSPLLSGLGPYDATQFASANAQQGRVLSVHDVHATLALACENSIEFWEDTGALSFPWQRIISATVEIGIATPFAWVEADNGHFFLGNDLMFYRLVSGQPQRLSTHALEKQWAAYSDVSDAFCHLVTFGGHKMLYLTFPTGNATFGYDLATGLWHRRASWRADGTTGRWRANCSWFGFHTMMLIGDSASGRIGRINPSTYTEFGDPIVHDLTSPHIDGAGIEVFMPEFQLEMESGVGLATGQGANPQVALLYSDDGGRTWSNEDWLTIGAEGEYLTRLRWDRLGSFYQRALRIKHSDPTKFVIIRARCPGLYAGASAG